MNWEKNTPSIYYDLFKYFHENHFLILLDDEIQEIIDAVNKWQDEKEREAIIEEEKK